MPDDTAVIEEEPQISADDQAALDETAFEEEFYAEEPTDAAKSTEVAEPVKDAPVATEEVEADEDGAEDAPSEAEAGSAVDRLAKAAETADMALEDVVAETDTVDSDQADKLAEMQEAADAEVKAANERAEAAEAALAKATAESNVISLEDIPTIDAFMDKLPSGDLKSELVEAAEDDPKLARLIMAAAVAFQKSDDTPAEVKSLRAELDAIKSADAQRQESIAYANDLVNGFTDEDGVKWKGHGDAVSKASSPEFQEWLSGRSEREQAMATLTNRKYSHMLLDAFDESKVATEVKRQGTVKDNKDALLSGGVKSAKGEGKAAGVEKSEEQEWDDAWEEEGKVLDAELQKRKGMRTI